MFPFSFVYPQTFKDIVCGQVSAACNKGLLHGRSLEFLKW